MTYFRYISCFLCSKKTPAPPSTAEAGATNSDDSKRLHAQLLRSELLDLAPTPVTSRSYDVMLSASGGGTGSGAVGGEEDDEDVDMGFGLGENAGAGQGIR